MAGYVVTQIQKVTEHFKPFLNKALQAMQDEDSITNVVVFTLARLIVIFILFGFILAVSKIIQKVIGNEIVMEEEIIVVHEHSTKEDAIKAQQQDLKEGKLVEPIDDVDVNDNENDIPPTSKPTRGKKQKSS